MLIRKLLLFFRIGILYGLINSCMPDKQIDKLLKQISRLVKQNQDLEKQLKELSSRYLTLEARYKEREVFIDKLSIPSNASKYKNPSDISINFDCVTVLFLNLHGFSKKPNEKDSNHMMEELDHIYYEFDNLLLQHNIHRIKTIGDSYLCAGGIPVRNSTNPVEIVLTALSMRKFLEETEAKQYNSKIIWDIGFGIHTGSVSATIDNHKKINYDIKGDTVNITSRIESAIEMRKIVISEMTYELIREFFDCEYYARIPVKNKGEMELYEVVGIKAVFSDDKVTPNDKFYTRFLLMQFEDMQEVLLNRIEKEMPTTMHYHNVKHTLDVVTQAELIGLGEGVSDSDILMLKTAALFHDIGYLRGHEDHENNSVYFAKEYLSKYGYSDLQILTVSELILATKMPPQPKSKIEQIICDADLDYLGRTDFIPVSNALYEELKGQNKVGSLIDWNKKQLDFISAHQYFTETARSLREVNKQKQIQRLREMMES